MRILTVNLNLIALLLAILRAVLYLYLCIVFRYLNEMAILRCFRSVFALYHSLLYPFLIIFAILYICLFITVLLYGLRNNSLVYLSLTIPLFDDYSGIIFMINFLPISDAPSCEP